MDRKIDKPKIVDPAAETAHRHLSWTPDDADDEDIRTRSMTEAEWAEYQNREQSFVAYTGRPDKTFEVTVSISRGDTMVQQTEYGVGDRAEYVTETHRRARIKALSALNALLQAAEQI